MSIKFDFVMEDVSGTIEAIGNNQYKLTAKDSAEETEGTKIISSREAAAILFCSFDEFSNEGDELEVVFETAQSTMSGFPVSIIP